MLTKKLHKQMRGRFYAVLVWFAVACFLGYMGVQVFFNGTGERSGSMRFGLKALFSSLLVWLEEHGHKEASKWILIALCAIAMLYVLYKLVKGFIDMLPQNTPLGKSICAQLEGNQDFKSVCAGIDKDMAGGYKLLGSDVYVSSSWIFEEEAMRISRIKKIYRTEEAFMDNNLVLEDVDGRSIKLEFVLSELADEAFKYFKGHLPLVEFVKNGPPEPVAMGKMYSWHVPVTENGVLEYKKLAEQGDVQACTEYGKCLLFGKGIKADGHEAYAWLKKAADSNNEIAKMYTGHCLLYGVGVEKDEEKGYSMLNDALEYNYPEESESQPLADYSQFTHEDLVQLFWDIGDAFEKGLGVKPRHGSVKYYFDMINDWGHQEGAERMMYYKKKK